MIEKRVISDEQKEMLKASSAEAKLKTVTSRLNQAWLLVVYLPSGGTLVDSPEVHRPGERGL